MSRLSTATFVTIPIYITEMIVPEFDQYYSLAILLTSILNSTDK